jgi:hypothetical protein
MSYLCHINIYFFTINIVFMKKILISVLFAGLFLTANSVWALGDNQKDKAPAKVENTEKKACCEKKEACCEKKEACCEKKEACCEKKEACTKKADAKTSACCTKKAANDAKSSGKK